MNLKNLKLKKFYIIQRRLKSKPTGEWIYDLDDDNDVYETEYEAEQQIEWSQELHKERFDFRVGKFVLDTFEPASDQSQKRILTL